jgi:Domain of unknown function (DUF1844)
MAAQTQAAPVPPIQAVLSEMTAQLILVAHAYLEPQAEGTQSDFPSAEVAIDVAGELFERTQGRLPTEERTALARMLTELRMTFVRKRGV